MATEVRKEAGIAAGKKVITGNYAVSYGAALARAQVIAAYPITPQTTIVELPASARRRRAPGPSPPPRLRGWR